MRSGVNEHSRIHNLFPRRQQPRAAKCVGEAIVVSLDNEARARRKYDLASPAVQVDIWKIASLSLCSLVYLNNAVAWLCCGEFM